MREGRKCEMLGTYLGAECLRHCFVDVLVSPCPPVDEEAGGRRIQRHERHEPSCGVILEPFVSGHNGS